MRATSVQVHQTLPLSVAVGPSQVDAATWRQLGDCLLERGELGEAALFYFQAGDHERAQELNHAIEQALRTASIEPDSKRPFDAPAGTTATQKYLVDLDVRFEGQHYPIQAFFKPRQGHPRAATPKDEQLAWKVADHFDLGCVPPTALRIIDGEEGYLQYFFPQAEMVEPFAPLPETIRVLTALVANTDAQNPGNTLIVGRAALAELGVSDVPFDELPRVAIDFVGESFHYSPSRNAVFWRDILTERHRRPIERSPFWTERLERPLEDADFWSLHPSSGGLADYQKQALQARVDWVQS